jgi:uncharacterized protein UPF0547
MSGGPPPGKEAESGHRDRPLPFPQPGGDGKGWSDGARWARANDATRVPSRQAASLPVSGSDSLARRVLSALALLGGGLLILLGVWVMVASRNQRGSGGVEVAFFTFLLAVPFVMVGIRGWQRPVRERELPAPPSRPAAPRTAPEAREGTSERPLPFPPRSAAPAAAAPAPEEAEHKTCPDCAETVLSEARVCRYCGYRFDRSPDSETPRSTP